MSMCIANENEDAGTRIRYDGGELVKGNEKGK